MVPHTCQRKMGRRIMCVARSDRVRSAETGREPAGSHRGSGQQSQVEMGRPRGKNGPATSMWDVRLGKRRNGRRQTRRADTFKRAAGGHWPRTARNRS